VNASSPTFSSLFRWFGGFVAVGAVMECYWGVGFRAGQARGLDFSSLRPLPSLLIVAMPLASLISPLRFATKMIVARRY